MFIFLLCFFQAFSVSAQEEPVNSVQGGIKLFEDEKYEQALEKFQKVVEAEPDNAEANLFLGMTYSKLDRLPEALEVLQRANKMYPENSEILLNLGITHYSLSQFEPALENLEKALKIHILLKLFLSGN